MTGYNVTVGSSDANSDTMLSGPAGARPTVLGRLHGGSSSMFDCAADGADADAARKRGSEAMDRAMRKKEETA